MLTPSYLRHAPEMAEEIAEELHTELMNRIVERILHRFRRGDAYILTAQDKFQLETLQESGFLLEDLQREIARRTGRMQSEIAEAMEDAGVRTLEYDDRIYRTAGYAPAPLVQSPYLMQLMERSYRATVGEWTNFTRTTANAAQQTFIRACDTAYHLSMTGAVSPTQAVREALQEVIRDGVYVQYPTGHRDTIETATARAVRTGISQASAQIQLARMDEFGVGLVLVSSHLGARPEHQVWQGKVYDRSGQHPKYPDFIRSTGYGRVDGLCGANCRHHFSPYFEGQHNPFTQYDSAENQKQYDIEQRQRTMERRIRDTKRQTMNWKTAMDKETDPAKQAEFAAEYQRKAALLKKQNAAYRDYCAATGQKPRPERLEIARWDRSQAAKAALAASSRIADVGESAAQPNWHTIPVVGGHTETMYRRIVRSKEIDSGGAHGFANKIIDENIRNTNPAYKNGGAPYRRNCQRCVVAYEMRRRGYDVIAKPAMLNEKGVLSAKDPLYFNWVKVFSGMRLNCCFGLDGGKAAAAEQMIRWGNGSVAITAVQWKQGGAHVFIAQNVDGVIRFIDPQIGSTDCQKHFTNAKNGATLIARIDNLEVS